VFRAALRGECIECVLTGRKQHQLVPEKLPVCLGDCAPRRRCVRPTSMVNGSGGVGLQLPDGGWVTHPGCMAPSSVVENGCLSYSRSLASRIVPSSFAATLLLFSIRLVTYYHIHSIASVCGREKAPSVRSCVYFLHLLYRNLRGCCCATRVESCLK
jgi:hypothetical protein